MGVVVLVQVVVLMCLYIYNNRNRTHYLGYNGSAGRCVRVVGSGLVYILCVIYIYNYTHRQSTSRLYNAGPRVRRVKGLVSVMGYVYILCYIYIYRYTYKGTTTKTESVLSQVRTPRIGRARPTGTAFS